ncbi:MAG: hypothetical protein ABIL76_03690 [candidate division WOR-3 bacterium]
MALGINGIIGLSLIIMDLSIKITLSFSGIKTYPDFGLFYVGIINVFFDLLKNNLDNLTRNLASFFLIISLLYPISNIIESLTNLSFLSKLETGGLWSLCIAIIVIVLSKLRI